MDTRRNMKKNPAHKLSKRIPHKEEKRKSKKKQYKVRNWHAYNESLVKRGSLDFWIEKGWIKSYKITIVEDGKEKIIKRGRPYQYPDGLIETVLLLGKTFHQRLRQAEGFVRSVFRMAKIDLHVPDFTTLSRRGKTLTVTLPRIPKDAVAAVLDSTGLKVFGEGEWKVRQHGVSKRRNWVKLHLSVDSDGEIRVAVVSDQSTDDATAGVELLREQKEEKQHINRCITDGAYDKRNMYDACYQARIPTIVIPPREDAKIWIHGNTHGLPHPRDENLRMIRHSSRMRWKEQSGYGDRARVENTMFRYKTILSDRVHARTEETQRTEVMLGCAILNRMMNAGMPESYEVP